MALTASPPDRAAALRKLLVQAVKLHGEGRYDEALAALASDKAAEKSATGQNLAGDILLKRDKPREALKAFEAAIRAAPGAAEPQANRSAALEALGRSEEALAAADKAIRLKADYAAAHFNRGNALKALGRLADAVAAYDRAIALRAGFAEAHVNRGGVRLALKQPYEALADFGAAVKLKPRYLTAHLGRASALRDLRLFDEALAAVDAAAAIEPDSHETIHLRAGILTSSGAAGEALALIDALIARGDATGGDHTSRAIVLSALQRPHEAIAAAQTALQLEPANVVACVVLGKSLAELGRAEESIAALEQARRNGADDTDYFHALALARMDRDPKASLAAFDETFVRDPDNVVAHNNRAYLRLALGDWTEGWQEHEWRLRKPERRSDPQPALPTWRGEDITGKRLFVFAEQGFGDTLQFVRYVRLLEGRAARIVLSVPLAIRALLADNFPGVDVVDTNGQFRDFDYRVSLMSLPAVFRTTVETVPDTVPYLTADPARIARWRERIGEEGLRVGLVWQGNPKYLRDRERSIALGEFAPLAAVPGVRFISLQAAGAGADQLKSPPAGMRIEELGEEITGNPDGFREVAAAMMNLDLLIMSDTGPTHLAGALGRPVWLALSHYPDWRWLRAGEATPWYPTMRLFRQTAPGDWRGVFERIAAELAKVTGRSA